MAEEAKQKLEENVVVEKVVVERVVVDKKKLDELLKKVSATLVNVTEVIQGNMKEASKDAKKTAFKAVLALGNTHVPELTNQVAEMRKMMAKFKGWTTTGMQTDNEHATTVGMQTDKPPSPEEVNLAILENLKNLSSRMITVSSDDVEDNGQHKAKISVLGDLVEAVKDVAAAIRQPMSVGLNSTLAALQFDVSRQVPPVIPASGENDGETEKSVRKRGRKTAAAVCGGDENPGAKKKKTAPGKQSSGSKGDD